MADRYTYQAIQGSGFSDAHYRITDTIGDDRVATCYLEGNARTVAGLMNRGAEFERLGRRYQEMHALVRTLDEFLGDRCDHGVLDRTEEYRLWVLTRAFLERD